MHEMCIRDRAYRDGARLHAGTVPGPGDRAGIERKIAYLVGAGFTREQAGMALFAAGQYTLCLLYTSRCV